LIELCMRALLTGLTEYNVQYIYCLVEQYLLCEKIEGIFIFFLPAVANFTVVGHIQVYVICITVKYIKC
jgi:hypothetical protein